MASLWSIIVCSPLSKRVWKTQSPKNQARVPFHFSIPPNCKVFCKDWAAWPEGLPPAVWSPGEARASLLVAWGWTLQWAVLRSHPVMSLPSCHRQRQCGSEWEPVRPSGLQGGALSVTAGFLPGPVQSHPLHTPAVVLHHDLQRGQALPEEQAAPEGECTATRGALWSAGA